MLNTAINDSFSFDGGESHTQQYGTLDSGGSLLVTHFKKGVYEFICEFPESCFKLLIGEGSEMLVTLGEIIVSFHLRYSFLRKMY